MTFRRRIVVLAAGAVAAAIALAAVVTFVVVRHELRAGVDAIAARAAAQGRLRQPDAGGGRWVTGKEAGKTTVGPGDVFQAQLPPTAFGGSAGVVQATLPNGDVIRSAPGPPLPDDRRGARGRRPASVGESLRDATVRGVHARVLTTRGPDGSTLQIAKPLTEVDDTLGRLRWILLAVTIGGVGVASGLGRRRLARGHAAARAPDRHRRAGHRHRRPAPSHRAGRRRRARAPGRAPSTRCSARWSPRATPSASSSPTPRTSCARR